MSARAVGSQAPGTTTRPRLPEPVRRRMLLSPNVMDFSVPEPSRALLAKLRQFVEGEVYPLEAAAARSFRAVLPELQKKHRCKPLIFANRAASGP